LIEPAARKADQIAENLFSGNCVFVGPPIAAAA